jgi:NNP family nitrate/nitrite transporter-like MFS transporter
MDKSFWKAGHTPTLFAAFLYFDLSFMVWYILGPMAVQIANDLQLSAQQRGLMVATPILAGAILRFVMGIHGRQAVAENRRPDRPGNCDGGAQRGLGFRHPLA